MTTEKWTENVALLKQRRIQVARRIYAAEQTLIDAIVAATVPTGTAEAIEKARLNLAAVMTQQQEIDAAWKIATELAATERADLQRRRGDQAGTDVDRDALREVDE